MVSRARPIEVYQMIEECKDIIPNQGTWVSLLTAYSHLRALPQGMKIHGLVIKKNLYSEIYMGTCLFDMYGKCGKLVDALSLFYLVPQNSAVPWNAIIFCHGIHGHSEKALELFKEMQAEGVLTNNITFVSLLSACSHSGLVDSGLWCFTLLQEEHGMKPSLKHYCCMVDLFGRSGQLDKAYNFVKNNMPIQLGRSRFEDQSFITVQLALARETQYLQIEELTLLHQLSLDLPFLGQEKQI